MNALGIIPAHAGKTGRPWYQYSCTRDHPRSRGENSHRIGGTEYPEGSSPLTRGKLVGARRGDGRRGIIPAHAGKTKGSRPAHSQPWDHPRSRGENHLPGLTHADDGGSSPLTRGKHANVGVRLVEGGIIPAHAGKTAGMHVSISTDRDHPRSRGENQSIAPGATEISGSSPLTRGKLFTNRCAHS